MVNMMREHVPESARIHYVITAGGKAPNVVPDFAEVYYVARHADMTILDTSAPLGSQEKVRPLNAEAGKASTDLGDVSWTVPTAELSAATWVPGTPAHSWQAVACGGTGIGTKGMMVAARALALTAADLFSDPSLVAAARAEFDARRGSRPTRRASRAGSRLSTTERTETRRQ